VEREIKWYTDPESVIKSWAKLCRGMKPGDWTKQRDKDVWETLYMLARWWKTKLSLYHVESHVDTKKDKNGIKRVPTDIEWMNIAVDKLADVGYTDTRVPNTHIAPEERLLRYVPYMQAEQGHAEVTGSFRRQILEEAIIQDTKTRAG
jgi:hypothetical protein